MSKPVYDRTVGVALRRLRTTLGDEGWDVHRSGGGPRSESAAATWRSLRVELRFVDAEHPAGPWIARLLDDGAAAKLQRGWDPVETINPIIAQARAAAEFCQGAVGLVANPSKGWLGQRMWHAVLLS